MNGIDAGLRLLRAINAKIETDQVAGESDNKPRFYVGASAVGEECPRARWYDFRWATKIIFEARMLRLFDRGHKEEARVLEWIGNVGAELRPTSKWLAYHPGSDCYALMEWDCEDPNEQLDDVTFAPWHVERAKGRGVELEQWSFADHAGHFSGHSDGKIRFVPGQELYVPADEWIGFECKTAGSKAFAEVVGGEKDRKAWLKDPTKPFPGKGVAGAKPEHVVQMQHYMHYLGTRLTLYACVNKDTDDIHFEFVEYDPKYHHDGETIIREVIHSPRHPRRISSHPSWFKCKMCDHQRTCHYGEPMQANCRTCVFSQPIDNAQWRCRKWNNAVIPRDAQLKGCQAWQEIKD